MTSAMSDEKVSAAGNFANKIWNASRFVPMNRRDFEPQGIPSADKLRLADKWILTRLSESRAR